MTNRDWTLEDIDKTIQNGVQESAPNYVYPNNPAIRYTDPETGKFVVRDEATKEILQISKEGFEPKEFP